MSIRAAIEDREADTLHEKACLSRDSRGRLRAEREGPMRTCFQRDRDRIIHSKSFRRLKHKTQVFLAPKGDHYRTRLTHVLEVSQIARTISRALRLNEDLAEAIALGHDLGHTPFGHAGESVLQEILPGGFKHYEQSLRVADFLEKDGKGLNLTNEVRDGIVNHSKGKGLIMHIEGKGSPSTLEGLVVRVSDIIAYLNHDLDDALRAGVIKKNELPEEVLNVLGPRHSKRIDTMVGDFVETTLESDLKKPGMRPEVMGATETLRDFLFKRVYEAAETLREFKKAKKMLMDLYDYYMEHPEEVFKDIPAEKKQDKRRMVCDFIAGMTDRFAIERYEALFVPRQWGVY
jgi:dGTPase